MFNWWSHIPSLDLSATLIGTTKSTPHSAGVRVLTALAYPFVAFALEKAL